MCKKIEIFKDSRFGEIRTAVDENGNIMFALKDVCDALGIQNSRDVMKHMDECYVDSIYVSTPIVSQGKDTGMSKEVQMTFVGEPNLYRCIFQSRKKIAKDFQKWVFDEVLPSIRKNGGYLVATEEDDEERWKDIDGLEGEYAVSTKGRVKNLKSGRILVGSYDSNGYRKVTINGKNYNIHRLVALGFIPNPQKLPQVDHIDEVKTNNDVSNLRWVSKSENTRHSNHKQSCKIKQLDKDGNLIRIWPSVNQIEHELGYSTHPIRNVLKGKQQYSYGYQWQYLDPSSQRIYNRQVIVYKGSEYIGTFTNARKAAEVLGLCHESVYNCLKGRKATTHGYSFKYAS